MNRSTTNNRLSVTATLIFGLFFMTPALLLAKQLGPREVHEMPASKPTEVQSYPEVCGQPVVVPLMGGTPAERPERYRQASPQSLLALGVPQYHVSASVVTPRMAREYRKLARASGDHVEILALNTANMKSLHPAKKPGMSGSN